MTSRSEGDGLEGRREAGPSADMLGGPWKTDQTVEAGRALGSGLGVVAPQ